MLHVIQLLVAPVVMISAGGLVCLALYNRLAAVVARARTFHKERFEAAGRLGQLPREGAEHRRMAARVRLLDEQVRRILARGRLLRAALICLMVTVLFMLGCSLALGLMIVVDWASGVALALFFAGVLTMGAAMVLAIAELRQSLDPVEMEQAAIREEDAGEHDGDGAEA